MNVKLGDYNTLTITRFTDSGAYLDGDGLEILMPRRYTTPDMHPGDEVRVFVYLDQENRPVATTEKPLAKVGQFACLTVAWRNKYGAFLDWGLMKDLFVPYSEQRTKMQQGEKYIVYIYIDEQSGRIVGTAKLGIHISEDCSTLQPHDEVEVLVYKQTEIGYKAIILGPNCEGLLYHNEVFQPLSYGDKLKAYVKKVRPDGRVDLVLQTSGRQHTEDFAVTLLRSLQEKPNHFIALNDNSDPEDIYDYFGVSKKTFKRAVGALYKEHIITITDDGLRLL
ncbi:MAG: GntR family transcriptional regulator [Bacteroidaceae bacterium]|nr:GntR family transcriptional regulator [Bacteroidaceae bacterium]